MITEQWQRRKLLEEKHPRLKEARLLRQRACRASHLEEYKARNRARMLELRKDPRYLKRERDYFRDWYAKNREDHNLRMRLYYWAHREHLLEYARKRRAENPEGKSRYNKEYRAKQKGRLKNANANTN